MAEQIDSVVEAVRADLLQRSKIGIAKYGVTLDRADLNLRDWLQHAYEETLDQANYLWQQGLGPKPQGVLIDSARTPGLAKGRLQRLKKRMVSS